MRGPDNRSTMRGFVFKRTVVHRYIMPILRCIPKGMWNEFSSLCASFAARTIGSPIRFYHKQFLLEEYPTCSLPDDLLQKFLTFCYPSDLPDRQRQIDCDRKLYWQNSATLLVFDRAGVIVGCIQIVFGSDKQKLPVEYARIATEEGTLKPFDIRQFIPSGNITEIYRCRRSFDLNRMEAIHVLMMLFKAVWAKTIQCNTAYSCISFDPAKNDLRHMYISKLSFTDPGISLTFGDDSKRWSLLVKDWASNETQYAAESTTHFYIQTWARMGLKQMHLKLPGQSSATEQNTRNAGSGNVLIAETFTAPHGRRLKKRGTMR